LHHVGLLLI